MAFWDKLLGKNKPKEKPPEQSLEDLQQALIAFINTESWTESQHVVEQHPELLRPETDTLMQMFAMAQDDEQAQRMIEEHRTLLARCREIGIEAAFVEKMRPAQAGLENIPPELLMRLLQAAEAGDEEEMRALLTEHPELLPILQGAGAGAAPSSSGGGGISIPPGFEADVAEVQRLQAQTQRDPRAFISLIQICERILKQLPSGEYHEFRAAIQGTPGNAYSQLPTGDRGANLAQAIGCYQEALRVYTPEAEPHDYRGISRNLANLHFEQEDWQLALDTYRAAIDVGERIYRTGLSTESRAAEVAENAILYRRAAFAAARLGHTADGLLTLEGGKTRLLAEALRLRVPRPNGVPDEVWAAFEEAGAAVRAAQAGGAAEGRPRGRGLGAEEVAEERDAVRAYEARVEAARAASAALDAAVERVREYAPDFLREIDLSAVLALLPDERAALVAFCITDQGSVGFVVSRDHDETVQMVDLPDFKQDDLKNLLYITDERGRIISGWIGDYLSRDTDRWHPTIERTLAEIGAKLLAPILAALPSTVERLILLPSGNLFLLPLHAAPLGADGAERVCDRYQVSYAPSAEVLADSRRKAARAGASDLYAVVNPAEDVRLVFTPVEGAAIAGLFTERAVHEGRAGTKAAVAAGVRGRRYLPFSCHGSYDWNDPPASGLALADGTLTLAELQRGAVDLSAARLVTLSACETGMSDVIKGSAAEYVGLPAGFLLAGVPCVVSSLWAVPDISTALLMERFYRNHLEGDMEFAAALRAAQAWVRELRIEEVAEYAQQAYEQTDRAHKAGALRYMQNYRYRAEQNPDEQPFAHPYYWAAFAVNGM